MFRPLRPGAAGALQSLVLGLLLLCTDAARAQSRLPPPALAGVVKDTAWAELLGRALFWDTVAVLSASPATAQVTQQARAVRAPSGAQTTADQIARTLLAHRPLDKYVWLIQRAFDDSLWKGADGARVERNFALIWRISTLLYESTLQSGPATLRVCKPNADGSEFECSDEAEPVRIVPIPSQGPAPISQDQPTVG